MRLIHGDDAVTRVRVRALPREAHGALTLAFTESDRGRAPLADAPRTGPSPRITRMPCRGGDRRGGNGVCLIRSRRGCGNEPGELPFHELRIDARVLLAHARDQRA